MDCTDSGIRATRGLLSTIIIVLLALQIVGMGVFMIDLNPLNTSPLASFDSYYGLRNDFLKMLLPIYMVFLQKVVLILIISQAIKHGISESFPSVTEVCYFSRVSNHQELAKSMTCKSN